MSPEIEPVKKLIGNTYKLSNLSWSFDGNILAAGVEDGTIMLWDVRTGELIQRLWQHPTQVKNISWSPSSKYLASCISSYYTRIWDIKDGTCQIFKEEISSVESIAWSTDETMLAVAGTKEKIIVVWDIKQRKVTSKVSIPSVVHDLFWSPNNTEISAVTDDSLYILNINTNKLKRVFLKDFYPRNLKLSHDRKIIASGISYGIRLWDVITGNEIGTLESKHHDITAVSFSHDGQFLASIARNGIIELWVCKGWKQVLSVEAEQSQYNTEETVAFCPVNGLLAAVYNQGTEVAIWKLNYSALLEKAANLQTNFYTTIKVALVGKSSVGKTTLGWRILHDDFKVYPSSHGQHFWLFQSLCGHQSNGIYCDVILWDLAGQPDYRITHSLFLSDVDIGLIFFDSSDQLEPFKDVEYWIKQLPTVQDGCRKILVGAKSDRGYSSASNNELTEFCRHHDITGEYVVTSALTGNGVPNLIDRIKQELELIELKATIAPTIFNQIKSLVLDLKEKAIYQQNPANQLGIIINGTTLRCWLEQSMPALAFSDEEMWAAVRHLARHGFVTRLRKSAGEAVVLLVPELLNNLAASFVLEARRNDKGLGAIDEFFTLEGKYLLPELDKLSDQEKDILIDAAITILIERNVCFRTRIGNKMLLVFPALINQKRPLIFNKEFVEGTSFIVTGAVENIYAELVVLLGYTNTFTRTNQWQNQAQYELEPEKTCGFRLIDEREGELQFVLYFDKSVPQYVQLLFEGLFEKFLTKSKVKVKKFPRVKCSKCQTLLPITLVIQFLNEDKEYVFCPECAHKVLLRKSLYSTREEVGLNQKIRREMSIETSLTTLRTKFEAALIRLKRHLQNEQERIFKGPTCFISYTSDTPKSIQWIRQLAEDLKKAEIRIILDQWDNTQPGVNIARFIERIETSEFVLVVATPLYKRRYSEGKGIVSKEFEIINARLIGNNQAEQHRIKPLLRSGKPEQSLPALLRGVVYSDFRMGNRYFIELFDLILSLYNIPKDDVNFSDLRDSLQIENKRF